MSFIADFHIHSKFSRATSRFLDLEHLYVSAQNKGITVLGTGDFTHPAWFEEIKTKLRPAEDGLFSLSKEIARDWDHLVPSACRQPVRFILVTEISNIYKKAGKTRKNHNLVFMPDIAAAEQFNGRMGKIGNIVSDGRPILGLDSRDLLEIVLETSPSAYLVPAHIWTPWFSLLGSKSGFDSVKECFDDLSAYIFAVETGLSSDPAMNWRVSGLDGLTLISNSDAHSSSKLGREANIFNTSLSYNEIYQALKQPDGAGFQGTVEFYPEEGKYHLDGHRKCGFRCHPEQTRQLNGKCPVCGKQMTLGVLYRVQALADREEGRRPPAAKPYCSLIPLESVLSEVLRVGAGSKKVLKAYEKITSQLGSEYQVLQTLPKEDLLATGIPLLAEAIERMRNNRIVFEPGYDGDFGRVRIFSEEERQKLLGQRALFNVPTEVEQKRQDPVHTDAVSAPTLTQKKTTPHSIQTKTFDLNKEQQTVVDFGKGSLLINAGPGTGKTRTIICRIASLIKDRSIPAHQILAVTFTQKASREMKDRLTALQLNSKAMPLVTTFHGLCWQLINETAGGKPVAIVTESARKILLADALRQTGPAISDKPLSPDILLSHIITAKQRLIGPHEDLSQCVPDQHRAQVAVVYATYQSILALQQLYDFEDLIYAVVRRLQSDPEWRTQIQNRFRYIFIDEFQDINEGQYRLVQTIARPETELCAIGDPDQAIYGFRGSDVRFFQRFAKEHRNTHLVRLKRNYRSTETILEASHQVIQNQHSDSETQQRIFSRIQGIDTIMIMETASAKAEAVAIGKTIENMVGGTGFHSMDFGAIEDTATRERSFADFAVLFRTNAQRMVIEEILGQAGIPCQQTDHQAFQDQPMVAKLLAVLRLMAGQACYADLVHMKDLTSPAVTKGTLQAFKDWAYTQQFPLWQAMQSALKFPVPVVTPGDQHQLTDLVQLLQNLTSDSSDMTVVQRIELILERTRLSDNAEQDEQALLKTIMENAKPFGPHLDLYLADLAIQTDTDLVSQKAEKVALLTMHAAKGLEFPIVFVAGCEDGLIPYRSPRSLRSPEAPWHADGTMEEEQRLFYVAMTRAKEQLILSWSRKRSLFGKTAIQAPSPFLNDIEKVQKATQAAKAAKQRQLSLF